MGLSFRRPNRRHGMDRIERLRIVTRWVFAATFLVLHGVGRGADEPIPYGFAAMEHPELLPFLLPNGTQTKQFVSYDTSGGNADGGMEHFRRYDENGEYVFFDEIGPGCLYRQQANVFATWVNFPSDDVHIRMYFDDESQPRLDMTFAEYFGKDHQYTAPFTPPFSFFATTGIQWYINPFANTYYPLPFQKRLKITASRPGGIRYDGTGVWYQYTYHKYPSGTPVETWAGPQVDSEIMRGLLDRVGEDPKNADGDESLGKVVSVRSGETVRVLDLKGVGSINSLRLVMDPWTSDTFYHVSIRIAWDNDPPAIDMPIGCFFGGGGDSIGAGDVSPMRLTTEFFGFDGMSKAFYSYWPMPFWSRARIEIVNDAAVDITAMRVDVGYEKRPAPNCPKGSCGYFAAKRTVEVSSDDAYYSRAFAERGRGKVMGVMMYSTGYAMDGDEFTYIDGSRTPQIHGDGTEDDHDQGWGGYAVQKPYWGGLRNGYNGAYRLYVNDSYVFNSRIDIRYEHSNLSFGTRGQKKTDFIVWYYLARPGYGNLDLTDELDVGKPASERDHEYAISGETGSVTTTSSYDTFEQGDPYPTTDEGRVFGGSSTFTVKLDRDNEGVKLRRRTNRNLSNVQKANVYVDGVLIPDTPWYLCDLPAPAETAFVDTDFEIPAVYTRRKDHITVRVEHVAGQRVDSSNEYYYWVYSYGLRRFSEQLPEAPEMTAKATGDGVELEWFLPLANARTYVIERREGNGTGFRRIKTLRGRVTSYVDKDVSPLASYSYRIRARNRAGASSWSQPIVAMGPPSRLSSSRGGRAPRRASSHQTSVRRVPATTTASSSTARPRARAVASTPGRSVTRTS